jgi:sortase A
VKGIKKGLGILLLLAGLFAFLSPDLYSFYFDYQTQAVISDFQEQHSEGDSFSIKEENADNNALYQQFQAYNQKIYAENQAGLTDAWSYEQSPFEESELDNDLFGYITIPAMNVELPLYLGATSEHLAAGAAVLGQTSIPIGGVNTNSVIAGHRGYQGAPYFREIENLQVGDEVFITNPFETLTYTVVSIAVIQPDDLASILVQDGKDMITLLTCHPYRSHGKYRYVVYCERSDIEESPAETEQIAEMTNKTGEEAFVSSEPAIKSEIILRACGAVTILVLMCLALKSEKHHKKRG